MRPFCSQVRSTTLRVIGYVALTAITVLSLNLAFEGILSRYRVDVIQKLATKNPEAVKHKADNRPVSALNKTAAELSFFYSLSVLRFDFKQNLRTWPILGNDLERSPPLAVS